MGEFYDFYSVLTGIKSYLMAYICTDRTEVAYIQSSLWFPACFMDPIFDSLA